MNEFKDVSVEVRDMPEMDVAYVRHIGPYQGNTELFKGLYEKLMKWAGPRGLLSRKDAKFLCIYNDDPSITEESKHRVSVCVTVPRDTSVDGEIGKLTIPAGKYAAARFEISSDEFGQAWDYVFSKWLPNSGYQPDDGPSYELYLNNHEEHPQKKHILDICVPVKPL